MEITNLSSMLGIFQNQKASAAENHSEQNFLSSLLEVAGTNRVASDVPSVYAGQGKEFEFWTKEEKVPSKPFKLRTLDDAIAEIEKVIRDIKKQ